MSSRFKSRVGQVLEEIVNTKGFALQSLRDEYAGEDQKLGKWRMPDAKPRADFASDAEYDKHLAAREELAKSDRSVTKYFSEAERKASEIKFDEQGRAVGKLTSNADGTVSGPDEVMGGKPKRKIEYVMGQQGSLHQFTQAVDKTGATMLNPLSGKTVDKTRNTHHSSILAGQAAAAAGEADLDYQGYLTRISNKSGHYKPGLTQMLQLLEELARQGALLDKSYLMPGDDGKGKALEGKPKQIFDAIDKVQAGLKAKISAGLSVEAELAAIDKGKQALAKLGAAPANKFRDVEVEFIAGADKKKGVDVRNAKGRTSTAEEFLRSGGGSKVKKMVAAADGLESGAVDYDEYSPEFIAKQLGIAVREVRAAESEPELLYIDDLFAKDALMARLGIDSVDELCQKIRAGKPAAEPRMEKKKVLVSDLKDEVRDELSDKLEGKRKALDRDAKARAAVVAAGQQERLDRLPQTLRWYQAELEKVRGDTTARSKARQKDLAQGIARIEAAMRPSDVSEAGLAKVLADLERQFEADRKPAAGAADAEMPPDFGSANISYSDFSKELIAARLGLDLSDVEHAEEEPGILYAKDLLKHYKKQIGVDSLEALFKKISGT